MPNESVRSALEYVSGGEALKMYFLRVMQEDGRVIWSDSLQELHFNRYVIHYIILGKKKDKFIFTVESVGQLHAAAIVKKSMSVLRAKLQDLRERIEWNVNICGC